MSDKHAKDTATKTWKRTNATPPSGGGTPTTEAGSLFRSLPQERLKRNTEQKLVGLKGIGMNPVTYKLRQEQIQAGGDNTSTSAGGVDVSVEALEGAARKAAITNPFQLLYLGNLAAFKVMFYYLITLETILTCGLTAGLTCYWYFTYQEDTDWQGGGMDFILLAFAVTSPIAAAIGMAFQRRERALTAISSFRSFSYHLYMAHCFWDWSPGGRAAVDVSWLEHCDAVLAQLISMGDELARFLSLPTTSRSRHRMTRSGRREASRTTEVAYYLIDSITTQRMTRLLLYSERLKRLGLPSGEVSRIRQYERFLSDIVEQLRMLKMYRSPQALRSFARIFTFILPPFYAPTFAQVAREVDSIGIGVTFGIITALGLTALFESLQVLEDPFTGYLALDGIDVREEFEVLHFLQLTNTRKLAFPHAEATFPLARRRALTSKAKVNTHLGTPPPQSHHRTESKATMHSLGVMSDTASLASLPPVTGDKFVLVDDAGVTAATSMGDTTVPLLFTEDDRAQVEEELGRPREDESSGHMARDSHILIDLQDDSTTTRSDDETVHNGRMLRNRSSWSLLSRRRMES